MPSFEHMSQADRVVVAWAMPRKDVRAILRSPEKTELGQAYFVLTDKEELDSDLGMAIDAFEKSLKGRVKLPGPVFQLPRSAYLKIEDRNAYDPIYQVTLQTPLEGASSDG